MFGLKMGELLIIALVLVSCVVPVLFLLTWARTLRLTRRYQPTAPGLVWLMLVPVLNLGWQFYLLRSTTQGIKGRLAELGRDARDGGFRLGVTYQSLTCLAALLTPAAKDGSNLSTLVDVLCLGALVTWIAYWTRIARFNRQMQSPTPW